MIHQLALHSRFQASQSCIVRLHLGKKRTLPWSWRDESATKSTYCFSGSVPSTHISCFTTTWNTSSKVSSTLFWPLLYCTQVHKSTHKYTHIHIWKKFFSKKNTMLTMSSRSCLQFWKHFHGRNAVQSTWLQNIMVQSTQDLLISSSVTQLLCTWVLPFQSGADNHINHQVMMRLQTKDSHGPHWNSTFCMAVCKKCESLLSLLFHVPRFPHQNRDNNTSPSPFPLDPDRLKCN